ALGRPFATALEELRDPGLELLDPKTLLQNRLAQAGKDAPRYEPRRAPRTSRSNGTVSVTLRLADGLTETGVGRGLKEAEKDAARRVLERLERRSGRRRSRPRRGSADSPGEATERSPAVVAATENPKGALQEALVKKEGRLPVYRLISESGPEHEKTFVMEVLAGRRALGRGVGPSKRKAEAEAAAAALASGI
ncbi:MAG: putative dsRNA-binding protein, partial [Acidobacteriota bacterium]|nr:putative dsRNA-binding protein [Acidobacteriota bacterium]